MESLCKDAKMPTSGSVDALKHRIVTVWLRSASQDDLIALGAGPPKTSMKPSSSAQPMDSADLSAADTVAAAATELKHDVAKPNEHQEAVAITKISCHVFVRYFESNRTGPQEVYRSNLIGTTPAPSFFVRQLERWLQ